MTVLAAAALGGCSPAPQVTTPQVAEQRSAPVPPSSSVNGSTTAGTAPAQAGGRRRGSDGGGEGGEGAGTVPSLPAGWPADIPVPPGQLQGSGGSDGAWTALLTVPGGADQVLAAAGVFYESNGFTRTGSGQLRKGLYAIVMVAQNRDHSAARTDLTVSLGRVG
ncbi:hypothetical protein DBZ45_03940 [Arthrobacter globiformis]|uniref:Uncharacterized protein n=1 Tax=Arthrobacter globiformis TaxID=1665 RepID=A0A328HK96_ARTGO|nr:hypothetical protein DBZ45_03940 [Arthrobacter globiformis]